MIWRARNVSVCSPARRTNSLRVRSRWITNFSGACHAHHTSPRPVGATALLVSTATVHVGRIIAQAVPTTDNKVSASACGAGKLVQCGVSSTIECSESRMLFPTLGEVARNGCYTFGKPAECEITESHALYRNP